MRDHKNHKRPVSTFRLSGFVLAASMGVSALIGVTGPAQAGTDPLVVEVIAAEIPDDLIERTGAHGLEVLSAADRGHYRGIFQAQLKGDWAKADALIAKLDDPLLMGYVRYQRYMHPTQYRASFRELSDWMQDFADHPGAKQIYSLAMDRKPEGATAPRAPKALVGRPRLPRHDIARQYRNRSGRSTATWDSVKTIKASVKRMVLKAEPTNALAYLKQPEIDAQLDAVETDQMRATIAAGYYHYGKVKEALEVAEIAAKRSGDNVPLAHWYAGLANWQQRNIKEATAHFTKIAHSDAVASWMRSAGAYWAARGYLIGLDADKVVEHLEIAAREPRTFYGLLAIRALGEEFPFEWDEPRLSDAQIKRLAVKAPVRRMIALARLGKRAAAEAEMRALYYRTGWKNDPDLIALAQVLDLPAGQYRIAQGAQNYARLHAANRNDVLPSGLDARHYDSALFPLPTWQPEGGFRVDRALIFAFMRQESRFDTHAQSGDGAMGVMQIMPATAQHVVSTNRLGALDQAKMYQPEYNIKLGQRYLEELLDSHYYQGDLLRLAAAYNGGPGNLRKWERQIEFNNDPLLFIESLPSRETRHFIEQVMANFWIYRARLGQPVLSLDALVQGEWPRYQPLDDNSVTTARR